MKALSLCLLLAACGGAHVDASAPAHAAPSTAASAPERTADDAKLDERRHPNELVAFIGAKPGMHAADLGAGGGYTTELLARAVGPTGKVWMQNDPSLAQRFFDGDIKARLARPVDANVVRVDRSFDAPLPPEATNLDVVTMFIFYHDTVWLGADRDKMNKAVFDALKPGGAFVIVDASAKPGDGVADAKTLHRIDEATVKAEVEKAGFKLAASADFLRNPSDKRDWNSAPMAAGDRRGTEDRFVLKFVKP